MVSPIDARTWYERNQAYLRRHRVSRRNFLYGSAAAAAVVPNSYVWNAEGDQQPEAVGWSRVRFRNYAFIRVDVRPGTFVSEMDVVAVDEYGTEFDKLTYRRPVRT
jgi:hypothetical protein